MEQLNALLVDDEYKSREVLRALLTRYCQQINIVADASGVSEAQILIARHKPDLVFLDIEMPEGGGFRLLEHYETPPFNVIFVTSYDSFALRAIKFSALEYLLKPVIIEELKKAVEKAILLRNQPALLGFQLQVLTENLQTPASFEKLFLNNKTKTHYVLVKDIQYLRADVNYTTLYMSGGQKHLLAKPLKEYDDLFCTPETGFLRIHKSTIINPAFVLGLEGKEPLHVLMPGHLLLEVSRRKRKEVEVFLGLKKK
jgi:two-component system LytT family response regulator